MKNPHAYEKTYFLDTNIILDDYENLVTLSQNSENLIVICETVLDELDSKKTVEGSLGYNSREFSRWMEKANVISKKDIGNTKIIELELKFDDIHINIDLIKMNTYAFSEADTDIKILNDRKIIECAHGVKEYYTSLVVLSNDIAFRSRCILDELSCESFKTDNKKISELDLYRVVEVSDDVEFPLTMGELKMMLPDEDISSVCGLELSYTSGMKKFGYIEGNVFYEISDDILNKQILKPINARQKALSSMILSDTSDVYVASGVAGTGKNAIVTSGCCALLEDKRTPYEKIVYIRANLDSIDDRDMELGFLPGPQPLWAKVLTPTGWKTMGDLNVGDEVIGRDGEPHTIVETFDKGTKDIFKISTTTGKTAYSCEDHLWATKNYNENKHNKPYVVRTLREIRETLLYKNGKINHYLPKNEVVQYKKMGELPVPPYVLGALLGDGSMPKNGAVCLHNIDIPIVDKVNEELSKIGCKINYESVGNGISYIISNINRVPNKSSRRIRVTKGDQEITFNTKLDCINHFNIDANKVDSICDVHKEYDEWKFERLEKNCEYTNILKDKLNSLGILGLIHKDKYIPEIYMHSSVEDRLELLRGLLDTDGHGHSRGQAYFTTVSEKLRDGVIELVRSLGGSTYVNTRDRRNSTKERKLNGRQIITRHISYTIGISIPNMNPFYLERKAVRYNSDVRCFYKDRIESVEYFSTESAKCIMLDSDDHLYITDDFIVTHNTIDDKMAPYMRPLKDTIETLARAKYKVAISKDKKVLDEKIEEFNEKYNIGFEAINFLRGGTIRNSLVILDECLSDDSILYTDKGILPISEITDRMMGGESFDVLSFNLETKQSEYKLLETVKKQLITDTNEKMYDIELEDGTHIKVTGNHKLFINGDYMKVSDCLNITDTELYLYGE